MQNNFGINKKMDIKEESAELPICAICTEAMKPCESHTLDCSHSFHTDCILKWFRSGGSTCPVCRCHGLDCAVKLDFMDVRARANVIKRIARRMDAPESLKRLYKSYREVRKQKSDVIKKVSELKKKFKEEIKAVNKLRSKRWRLERRELLLNRELGMFCEAGVNLDIPIVVPRSSGRGR